MILGCKANFLDVNHNHSVDFKDRQSQYNFYWYRQTFYLPETQFQRKNKNVVRLPYSFDTREVQLTNYIVTRNNNKYYYYFVVDKEYVNEDITNLYLKLDVIQTYFFDMTFKTSYIERQHFRSRTDNGNIFVNRLNVPENIETGEYIVRNKETIYSYNDKGCFVAMCSDKLSPKKQTSSSGDTGGSTGGGGSDTGTLTNYSISKNYLLYLKQAEGFASVPYDIGDGTRTTGYGCTEAYQPSYFNQLLPNCTEKKATEVTLAMVENGFASGVKNACGSKVPTQCQFDAMVDYAYNCGVGGLSYSNWFNAWLNGSSTQEVAGILKGENITYPGHVIRRELEADMFLGNYPKFTGISDVSNGGYVTDNNGQGYIPDNLL